MLKIPYIIVLFTFFLNTLPAHELHLESGIKRNTLIELFTSEGCSSCPPAEKYLNSLKDDEELWKKKVPVAFHVDYWDYIGWKDRYARKEFGQRQSRYANLMRASTVYTPAFIVNGMSWRKGIFSRSLPEANAKAGNLSVTLKGKILTARYNAMHANKRPLVLNIAVLGMGLTTQIERGENAGRTARHEFVVLGFDSKESDKASWSTILPALHYSGAKKYALAVWVSEGSNPTPLQVVAAELPGDKL